MERTIERALAGTPYLLPDEVDIAAKVAAISDTEVDLRSRLIAVYQKLSAGGLYVRLGHQQRVREIFESNAIEYVGPGFRDTAEILSSPIADKAIKVVQAGMLVTTLTHDPRLLSVLGIHGAKNLAERIVADSESGRPITEADIRSIHQLISSGEWFAGAYRQADVGIQGARHRPPSWLEVQRLMQELVLWLNGVDSSVPGTLVAAVLHAWFTHIHPFEDGNGRTARILANMIMARKHLPPIIVRHGADRAEYLDALGISDEGGDILPFCGVFGRTLKRFMREVEKPRFINKIFEEEIGRRGGTLFEQWNMAMNAFVGSLAGELEGYRLRLDRVGDLDLTSFELIRRGDSSGNTWFLKIVDSENRELLVWIGYSSWQTARALPDSKQLPALYFSVRNPRARMRPYRRLNPDEFGNLSEVVVVPDVVPRVYARFEYLRSGGIQDLAARVAEVIYRSFVEGYIPLPRRRADTVGDVG